MMKKYISIISVMALILSVIVIIILYKSVVSNIDRQPIDQVIKHEKTEADEHVKQDLAITKFII